MNSVDFVRLFPVNIVTNFDAKINVTFCKITR